MNKHGPVLVTTDGSSHSHRVLPHAALLTAALGSRFVLLRVVEDGSVEQAAVELQAALARLGIEGATLAQAKQPNEDVADAILRLAREQDAACIAMDSRGHGALRHLLQGSVALDVLRKMDRPLLVSGPNLEPPPVQSGAYRIVVTNDGSPAAEAVLRSLAALLPPEGFEVTLLRIHEHAPGGADDAVALEACRRELDQARSLLPASLAVQTLVREIPRGAGVDTAIVEKALELGAHAIAMSTHGQTASRHVIIGSMATTLLGRSPLPLLLARADV